MHSVIVQDVYFLYSQFVFSGFGGSLYHINVKAQFRPNEQFVRSTCVCPQLEANSFIPVGLIAFAVGVEPPPC